MLRETMELNENMYEDVKLDSFDNDEICTIAENFIINHKDETINYIAYCLGLTNKCSKETYDVVFKVVNNVVKNNNEYYFNRYIDKFCFRKSLVAISLVLPLVDESIKWDFDVVNDDSVKVFLSDGASYNIVSDNTSYILVDEAEHMIHLKNEEELINRLNFEELAIRVNLSQSKNQNLLFENILEFNSDNLDDNMVLVTNNDKFYNISNENCVLVDSSDINMLEANIIPIQSLKDLYGYLLKNHMYVNKDRIVDEGLYLGEDMSLLLKADLTFEYK